MRYEYQCPRCGKTEEKYHSIKEDPVFYCNTHRGSNGEEQQVAMTRVISAGGGIIFTGDGFHCTDYK